MDEYIEEESEPVTGRAKNLISLMSARYNARAPEAHKDFIQRLKLDAKLRKFGEDMEKEKPGKAAEQMDILFYQIFAQHNPFNFDKNPHTVPGATKRLRQALIGEQYDAPAVHALMPLIENCAVQATLSMRSKPPAGEREAKYNKKMRRRYQRLTGTDTAHPDKDFDVWAASIAPAQSYHRVQSSPLVDIFATRWNDVRSRLKVPLNDFEMKNGPTPTIEDLSRAAQLILHRDIQAWLDKHRSGDEFEDDPQAKARFKAFLEKQVPVLEKLILQDKQLYHSQLGNETLREIANNLGLQKLNREAAALVLFDYQIATAIDVAAALHRTLDKGPKVTPLRRKQIIEKALDEHLGPIQAVITAFRHNDHSGGKNLLQDKDAQLLVNVDLGIQELVREHFGIQEHTLSR